MGLYPLQTQYRDAGQVSACYGVAEFLDKADAPVLIDQEGGRVVRLDRRISRFPHSVVVVGPALL